MQTVDLAKLRAGHPRLIVLDSELERVNKLTTTDPNATRYLANLVAAGEKLLADPKTVEYKLIGPRLLNQSRACLSRVYTLAALWRLEGDKKWVERAKKELFAAAAFPDWNPSHFLDVAEMTHAFAIGYDWLFHALTAEEKMLLKTAIVEKGLRRGEEAYQGTKPWKWWTTAHHNWNQVCNGGLSLGALAIADEEPQLSSFILNNALKSLPTAMASFGPDGGWNEGPGYWDYTVRYTVPLIAGLESALGSDFGIATAHGFERTGTFRLYFVGPTGKVFNYADGGDNSGAAPELRWLARRFKQPLYDWEANRGAGRFGGTMDLLWYAAPTSNPKKAKAPLDNIFRGIDAVFLRSDWGDKDALWVGFKGGDNTANHAHLDLGTFVFDALGERWMMELGPDNYNLPAYFGDKRWTYYRLRTEGQNTLTLDNENQGIKAKAPLLAFSPQGYTVANLTAGYPKASKLWRGVALVENRMALLIQDELTARQPVEVGWRVHTLAQVSVSGREATLTLNGKTCTARILEPAGAVFVAEDVVIAPVEGSKEQPKPTHGERRLMVRLPGKVTEARIAVLLTPGDGPKTTALTPLSEWVRSAPPLPKLGGSLGS